MKKRKKASTTNMIPMSVVKKSPPNQGTFRIDQRTILEIPAHITDVEKWKQRMIDKYSNYEAENIKNRLTGCATKKLSVSSKLLKAVKESR